MVEYEVFGGDERRGDDERGRLAVLLVGHLKSFLSTCSSFKENVVNQWSSHGNVDVFIYTYTSEIFPPPSPSHSSHSSSSYSSSSSSSFSHDKIEGEIRDCLGGVNLISVTFNDPEDFKEVFSGEEKLGKGIDMTTTSSMMMMMEESQPKGKRVKGCFFHILNSQLKLMQKAGEVVFNQMAKEGVEYQVILKTRPDIFWKLFTPLHSLSFSISFSIHFLFLCRKPVSFPPTIKPHTLYIPHPANEHLHYTPYLHGEVHVGISDHTAFASPLLMSVYLDFYHHFHSSLQLKYQYFYTIFNGYFNKIVMVAVEQSLRLSSWEEMAGCDEVEGELRSCHSNLTCSIESFLMFYLRFVVAQFYLASYIYLSRMRRVEIHSIWDWTGFIQRRDGKLMKNCLRGWACRVQDLEFSNE